MRHQVNRSKFPRALNKFLKVYVHQSDLFFKELTLVFPIAAYGRDGFNALDFLSFSSLKHIPPKGAQLIRRYGLYSSRIKGAWDDMAYVAERAPAGWKADHVESDRCDTPAGFDQFIDSDTADSKDI